MIRSRVGRQVTRYAGTFEKRAYGFSIAGATLVGSSRIASSLYDPEYVGHGMFRFSPSTRSLLNHGSAGNQLISMAIE